MAGPEPLHALVGNMWVPAWAIRPGAYRALAPYARYMPLWLLLHSRSGDTFFPCYANREQLGATLDVTRNTIGRHLEALRSAHLLFDLDRGREPKTRRNRAVARWALDPFAADIWRPKVEESLARIAEDDGQDRRWYNNAVTSLDAFERRSRRLSHLIADDMPFRPKPRKRKKSKKKRAGVENSTAVRKLSPRGGIYQGGEGGKPSSGSGGPSVNGKSERERAGRRPTATPRAADSDSRTDP